MKGDDLPIVQALKGKQKPPASPRTFEIQYGEVPGLSDRMVGEPITVILEGHISQQNDGRSVMSVSSVKPETEYPADEVRVRTQQSHAG